MIGDRLAITDEQRQDRKRDKERRVELRARTAPNLPMKPIRMEYNGRKAWASELLGGCCQRCGYHEFFAALHFHHVDPSTKTQTLAAVMATGDDAAVMAELDKCALMCGNCHQALHKGSLSIVFVKRQELGWTVDRWTC